MPGVTRGGLYDTILMPRAPVTPSEFSLVTRRLTPLALERVGMPRELSGPFNACFWKTSEKHTWGNFTHSCCPAVALEVVRMVQGLCPTGGSNGNLEQFWVMSSMVRPHQQSTRIKRSVSYFAMFRKCVFFAIASDSPRDTTSS